MSPSSDRQGYGELTVYGPHWTAEIVLYDGDLRQVERDVGVLRARLPVGIYQVEVRLADARERQFAAVDPGGVVTIDRGSWSVEFASAAPLHGTWTTDDDHQEAAQRISRRVTWERPEGGDSRLFFFVRTVKPGGYINFGQGLSLWSGDGALITDFSHGVEENIPGGWLGCTVDLPAGSYLLRLDRPDVPQRVQPIWLSPDWETHVFVPAGAQAFLADMSVMMAHRGAGFWPDDDAAVAAEVVLDGLLRGKNLASSEQMRDMLRGKFENPWLGILAAHATRLDPDPQRWVPQIVLHNIRAMIGDHPDVRALLLKPDHPAEEPFDHPPMLRASLKLVRAHADRHPQAIPRDSLTARIYDALLIDSPWTAWSNLDVVVRGRSAPTASSDSFERVVQTLRDYADGDKGLDEIELPQVSRKRFLRQIGMPWEEVGPFVKEFGRRPEALEHTVRSLRQREFGRWLAEQDVVEISRQMGLPRVRVEGTFQQLQEHPDLLEGSAELRPAEQATIDYLRERFDFESGMGA